VAVCRRTAAAPNRHQLPRCDTQRSGQWRHCTYSAQVLSLLKGEAKTHAVFYLFLGLGVICVCGVRAEHLSHPRTTPIGTRARTHTGIDTDARTCARAQHAYAQHAYAHMHAKLYGRARTHARTVTHAL
jgi:hypothetical protein